MSLPGLYSPPSSSAVRILDDYFLETRARLLEIAANLDRIDRTPDAAAIAHDPRLAFIQNSLVILQRQGPGRAEAIQRLYSKD